MRIPDAMVMQILHYHARQLLEPHADGGYSAPDYAIALVQASIRKHKKMRASLASGVLTKALHRAQYDLETRDLLPVVLTFADVETAWQRVISYGSGQKRTIVCRVCNARFTWAPAWRAHMESHADEET